MQNQRDFSAIKISVQFNLHDSGFAKETQREKMRGEEVSKG